MTLSISNADTLIASLLSVGSPTHGAANPSAAIPSNGSRPAAGSTSPSLPIIDPVTIETQLPAPLTVNAPFASGTPQAANTLTAGLLSVGSPTGQTANELAPSASAGQSAAVPGGRFDIHQILAQIATQFLVGESALHASQQLEINGHSPHWDQNLTTLSLQALAAEDPNFYTGTTNLLIQQSMQQSDAIALQVAQSNPDAVYALLQGL